MSNSGLWKAEREKERGALALRLVPVLRPEVVLNVFTKLSFLRF